MVKTATQPLIRTITMNGFTILSPEGEKRLVLRNLDPDKLPAAARWQTEGMKTI